MGLLKLGKRPRNEPGLSAAKKDKPVSAAQARGEKGASRRPTAAGPAEPQYRNFTEWTPALLRRVLSYTDSGDLKMVSDLCDCLLGDDRIQAAFSTRVGGLLGSQMAFEASSNGGAWKRKQAVKAIEVGEDWWEIFPEDEAKRLIIWGLLLGVGFAQLIWEEKKDHNDRFLPRIRVWHPRWFKWDYKAQTWLHWNGTEWKAIVAGAGEWLIYTPYGATRPWAWGLWRGLSVLWLLKYYAIRDWARLSEAHGQPAWVIEGEANYKLRKELVELFADLGRNPAIGLPKDVKAELIQTRADTGQIFESQTKLANTGYAVLIVGGNLAIEVDGNQQTGATSQTLVRIDYKRSDAASFSTTTHDQVLVWWAEWNFGDRAIAPWATWLVEPPENAEFQARTWLLVAKSVELFRVAGYTIDLPAVVERFNIPLVATVDPQPKSHASATDQITKPQHDPLGPPEDPDEEPEPAKPKKEKP